MITQRNVILPVLLYGCETWYHISHITEITQTGSVQEQGTEENIWNYEEGSNRRLKKMHRNFTIHIPCQLIIIIIMK
jgi:hypothetical protein